MKLNHRLLITSGLLLAMSTVAMSTATYAWFTTNRQAKFSTANVGIKADSNLEYRVISVNGALLDYSKEGALKDVAGMTTVLDNGGWTAAELPENVIPGDSLTDVSGNGAAFFKPTMGASANYYSNIKEVNTNGAYVAGSFMTLQVEFRSSAPFEVYLGPNTALTDVTTSTTSLAKAARIAYFDYGQAKAGDEVPSLTLTNGTDKNNSSKDTGTYSCVFVSDADQPRFITTASETGGAFDTMGEGEEQVTGTVTYSYFPVNSVQNQAPSQITSTAASANTKKVTQLVKNTNEGQDVKYTDNEGNENVLHTSVIEIRIWVEGTDVDCVDTAKKSTFKATLDFQAYLA